MSALRTEAELAEVLQIDADRAATLRRAHKWPHVRLGRFDVRYTDQQVAAIIAMQTVKPGVAGQQGVGLPGQSPRSARRSA